MLKEHSRRHDVVARKMHCEEEMKGGVLKAQALSLLWVMESRRRFLYSSLSSDDIVPKRNGTDSREDGRASVIRTVCGAPKNPHTKTIIPHIYSIKFS